ncbi:MAG: SDR family NAD(P)-dependent oxidoreductase [Planctomycetota bacterium]
MPQDMHGISFVLPMRESPLPLNSDPASPMNAVQAAHDSSPSTQQVETPTPPHLSGVPPEKRRAIVVGASSGIGAALVRQLAAEGYQVAALARREDKLEELRESCAEGAAKSGGRVLTKAHDVLNTAEIPTLFEELVRELGGIDLFIYAAGIMPKTEPGKYDTEQDLAMVQINFSGCIAWCNEVANTYRTQREGTLVGISSSAGDRGRKANPVYGATKAGMDHYLEALRNRMADVGCHVTTIKPGFIDTDMTKGIEGMFWLIDAEEAARTILSSARNRANTRYVPWRWRLVGTAIKSIPSFLFKRLNV